MTNTTTTADIETPRVLQSTSKETTIDANGASITTVTKVFSDGSKENEKTTTNDAAPTTSTRVAKPVYAEEEPVTAAVISTPPGSSMAPGSTIASGDKPYRSDAKKEGNCMATASMVCGIISIFLFGIILGVLAIIFGSVALGQIKKEPERFNDSSKCKANTGLTCGIVGVVVWVIIVITYL